MSVALCAAESDGVNFDSCGCRGRKNTVVLAIRLLPSDKVGVLIFSQVPLGKEGKIVYLVLL